MRTQVAVFFDRADIIEYEIALATIVITNSASCDHDRTQNTSGQRSRHISENSQRIANMIFLYSRVISFAFVHHRTHYRTTVAIFTND